MGSPFLKRTPEASPVLSLSLSPGFSAQLRVGEIECHRGRVVFPEKCQQKCIKPPSFFSGEILAVGWSSREICAVLSLSRYLVSSGNDESLFDRHHQSPPPPQLALRDVFE